MKKQVLVLSFVGASLALALGVSLAWYLTRDGASPSSLEKQTDMGANTNSAGMNAYASMWSTAPAQPSSQVQPRTIAGPSAASKMDLNMRAAQATRAQALTDPAALRELIQKFESERDPQARQGLKLLLSTIKKPEVVELSKRLVASNDVEKRRAGLELMYSLSPDSAEARQLIRQLLSNEQVPAVLVQALLALAPASVDSAEEHAILAQLASLAQHGEPSVRRQSILRLGQWDKNGEAAASLTQALADQAAEVRQAAVMAITQSNLRTDAAKSGLLTIIANSNEGRQIRDSALRALERFSLTSDEQTIYRQAQARLNN